MMENQTVKNQEAQQAEDAVMTPQVDVLEDASGITLYADLPGVAKDKLRVRLESDTLTLEGEINLPLIKDLQVTHMEVPVPRCRRTFTLGQELDRDKVVAEFKQGVLKLHIPKLEHVKPRRIEVQVA